MLQRPASRPVKPPPLHEPLKAKGAVNKSVYGFEGARWFAKGGVAQVDHHSFKRTAVHDIDGVDAKALHTSKGIMDVTAFPKVMIEGPDAHALLDRLTTNKLPQKLRSIKLKHMLNRRRRVALRTAVVRMAEDRFYLVCAKFFEQGLLDLLA